MLARHRPGAYNPVLCNLSYPPENGAGPFTPLRLNMPPLVSVDDVTDMRNAKIELLSDRGQLQPFLTKGPDLQNLCFSYPAATVALTNGWFGSPSYIAITHVFFLRAFV